MIRQCGHRQGRCTVDQLGLVITARIQYFIENENGPGTYNLMTEDGFRLVDAAVKWALTQK